LKSSESVPQLKRVCAAGASAATLSALSDSLLDISTSETLEAIGEEVRTSGGKDWGTCIVWENDFAGAKSMSVKRVSLYGKIPVVENTK